MTSARALVWMLSVIVTADMAFSSNCHQMISSMLAPSDKHGRKRLGVFLRIVGIRVNVINRDYSPP